MNVQPVKGRYYNESNYFNQGNEGPHYHQDSGFNKRGHGRDKYSYRGRGGSKHYNTHKPHYSDFSKNMKFSSNRTSCGEFKASPYSASRDLQDSSFRSSEDVTRSSSRSLSPEGHDGVREMPGKENTGLEKLERKKIHNKYSTDSERNRNGNFYYDRERHKRYKDYNEHYEKDRRYTSDFEKSRFKEGEKKRELDGSRKRSADIEPLPSSSKRLHRMKSEKLKEKRTLSDRFGDICSAKTALNKTKVLSDKSETITKSEQFSTVEVNINIDCTRSDHGKTDSKALSINQSEKLFTGEKSEESQNVQAKSDSETSKSYGKECTDSDTSFEMKIIDEAEISGKSEEGNKSFSDDMELSEVVNSPILVGNDADEKGKCDEIQQSEKEEMISKGKDESSQAKSPLQTLVLEVVENIEKNDTDTNKMRQIQFESRDANVLSENDIAYVSNISLAEVSTLSILEKEEETKNLRSESSQEKLCEGTNASHADDKKTGSHDKSCTSDQEEKTSCNSSENENCSKNEKSTFGNKNNSVSYSDSSDDTSEQNHEHEREHLKEGRKDGKSGDPSEKHFDKKPKVSVVKPSSRHESCIEKAKACVSSSDAIKDKQKLKRTNSSLLEDETPKRARHKTSEGSEFHIKKSRKDSGKTDGNRLQEQNDKHGLNSKESIECAADKKEAEIKKVKKLPQLDVLCVTERDESLPQLLSPAAQKAKRLARKMSIAKDGMLANPEAEKLDAQVVNKTENVKDLKERRKSGSTEKTKALKSSTHLFGPPPDLFAPDPVTMTKKKNDAEERLALAKEKVKSKTPNAKSAKEVNISKSGKGKIQVTEKSLKHTSSKNSADTYRKIESKKSLSLVKKSKHVDVSAMKSSDKIKAKVPENESLRPKVKEAKKQNSEESEEDTRKKDKPKDRNIFEICNFSESPEKIEKKRKKSGEKESVSNSVLPKSKSKFHHRKECSSRKQEYQGTKKNSLSTKEKCSQLKVDTSKSVMPDSTESSIPNQLISNMGESISIFGDNGIAVFGSKQPSSNTRDDDSNSNSTLISTNNDTSNTKRDHSNTKKDSPNSNENAKSDSANTKIDTANTSRGIANTDSKSLNTNTDPANVENDSANTNMDTEEEDSSQTDWQFAISSDSDHDDEVHLTSEKQQPQCIEPGHQSYDDISSCETDDEGRLQIDLSRQSLSDTKSSDEKLDESLDHDDTLEKTVIYDGNNTLTSNASTSLNELEDRTLPYTNEEGAPPNEVDSQNASAESSAEDANSDVLNSSHENLLEEVNSGDVKTFLFNKGIPESPWIPAPPTPAPPTPVVHIREEEEENEEDPNRATSEQTVGTTQLTSESMGKSTSEEGSHEHEPLDKSRNPEMEILDMVDLRPSVAQSQSKKQKSVLQEDQCSAGAEVEKTLSQHIRDFDETLMAIKKEIPDIPDSEGDTDSSSINSADSGGATSLSVSCLKKEQEESETSKAPVTEKLAPSSVSTVSPNRKMRSISTDTGLKQMECRKTKNVIDQKQQIAMLSLLKELRQANFSACSPIAFTHIKTLENGRTVNTIGHLDPQKFKETKLTIIQCQGCQRWFTCSEFFLHVDGEEEVSSESVRAEPWPTRKLSEMEQSVWEKFLRIKSYFMEKVIPGLSDTVVAFDSTSSLHTITEVQTSSSATYGCDKSPQPDKIYISTSQTMITSNVVMTQISTTCTSTVSVTSSSQYMSMPVLVGTVSSTVLPPLQPQLTTAGSSTARQDDQQEKNLLPGEQAKLKSSQMQKSAPRPTVSNQNSGVTVTASQKSEFTHPFHRSVSDSQLPRHQTNSTMINPTSTRQSGHLRSPPDIGAQQAQRIFPANINLADQSNRTIGSSLTSNSVRQMPQANISQPVPLRNYAPQFSAGPSSTPAPPPLHRFTNPQTITTTLTQQTCLAATSSSQPTLPHSSSECWNARLTNRPSLVVNRVQSYGTKFAPHAAQSGVNQTYQTMNSVNQSYQPINRQLHTQSQNHRAQNQMPYNQMAQNQITHGHLAQNMQTYSQATHIHNGQSVSLRDVPYMNPSQHSMQNTNPCHSLPIDTNKVLLEYVLTQKQKFELSKKTERDLLRNPESSKRCASLSVASSRNNDISAQCDSSVIRSAVGHTVAPSPDLLAGVDLTVRNRSNSGTSSNDEDGRLSVPRKAVRSNDTPMDLFEASYSGVSQRTACYNIQPPDDNTKRCSGAEPENVRNNSISNSEYHHTVNDTALPSISTFPSDTRKDSTRMEGHSTENTRKESSGTDSTRMEGHSTENTRKESSGTDSTRMEGHSTENTRKESSGTDSTRMEGHSTENTRKDSSGTDSTRMEGHSTENTRKDSSGTDSTRMEGHSTENTRKESSSSASTPLSFETLSSQIKNLDECSHLMTMSYQLNFAVFEHMKKSLEETKEEIKKLKEENEHLKTQNEQYVKQMEEKNTEIASLIEFKESIVNIATRKDS